MGIRRKVTTAWHAISTVDTVVGILQISGGGKSLFAVVGGVVAVVISWVTSVPVWGCFVLAIVGICGGLFAYNELMSKRLQQRLNKQIRGQRAVDFEKTPETEQVIDERGQQPSQEQIAERTLFIATPARRR